MVSRRQFLHSSASVLAAAALNSLNWSSLKQKKPSNVLMLIVDDLNDWVGAMGGHPNAKTPNIDKLASQGTLFTNAHAPAPLCGPSRASIMTGLLPSSTGIYGHVADDDIKKANSKAAQSIFLSDFFKQHGYKTLGVGKVFHIAAPINAFDEFGGRVKRFGPYPKKRMKWHHPKTNTDWGPFPDTDQEMPDYQAAKWMQAKLSEKHNKPFFMAGGFLRPHVPWHVPQKWFDMHPIDELELPEYLPSDLSDVPELAKKLTDVPMMPTTEWAKENGEYKAIVQAYLASVSFVDSCVGMVLDALENSQYADNTAIVLWGDHGYQLGEKGRFAKMALWDKATRTPLIIKAPNSKNGNVSAKPVSLLDIYPTLIKICNLPSNPLLEGKDISPLLQQPQRDWPYAALTTYGPKNHAVKTERYRYIIYEDGSEELYDHKNDVNEWNNLASHSEYQGIVQQLRSFLPKYNAKWSPVSEYSGNEYFESIMKTVEQDK